MKRYQAALIWLAIGLLIAAVAASVLLDHPAAETKPTGTPSATRISRGPIIVNPNDVESNPTRYPAVINSTNNSSAQEPPFRPAYDPLYKPGSRYPQGTECLFTFDRDWGTKPVGGASCTTWPCSASNFDWSEYDNCVHGAAAYTVTLGSGAVVPGPVALTIPPRERTEAGTGDPTDPYFTVQAPSWWYVGSGNVGWLQKFTYTHNRTVNGVVTQVSPTYWGVNYDDPSFVNRMKQLIGEAAARYGSERNVVAVRINVGYATEGQPIKMANSDYGGTDAGAKAAHEAQVASCAAYRAYVRTIANYAYDVFSPYGIPVYVAQACALCGGDSQYNTYMKSKRWLWEDPTEGWALGPTKRNIGYSGNAVSPDHPDADETDGNVNEKQEQYVYGFTVKAYPTPAPVAWEYQYTPANLASSGTDKYQYDLWTAYTAAGTTGQVLYPFTAWNGLHSDLYWDVIDHWLGDYPNRAWTVLRDAEYPEYNWQAGYGKSGLRGNLDHYLTLLMPTPGAYPQACSTPVQQTAKGAVDPIAATQTPVYRPCGYGAPGPTPGKTATPVALPTPKATFQPQPSPNPTSQFNVMQEAFNRQARILPQGKSMSFAVSDEAPWYGETRPVTITVSYMDIGTGSFTVQYQTSPSGGSTSGVSLGNSGLWKRAVIPVSQAYLGNASNYGSGNAFMAIIQNSVPNLYLHEVYFDLASETPPAYNQMIIHAEAFHDRNSNTYQDGDEEYLAGVTFKLQSQAPTPTVYSTCTTSAAGTCDLTGTVESIQDIAISESLPGIHTSPDKWPFNVQLGTSSIFPWGLVDDATATPSPTPTATRSPGTVIWYGWGDANGNHVEDANETHVAPVGFWIASMDDPNTSIAECTTVDPNVDCHFTLAAGTYYINVKADPHPALFTPASVQLPFAVNGDGQQQTFYMRFDPIANTPTPTLTPAPTPFSGKLHVYAVDNSPQHNLLAGGSWMLKMYRDDGSWANFASCSDPCSYDVFPPGSFRAYPVTAPAGYTATAAYLSFNVSAGQQADVAYPYAMLTPTPTPTATSPVQVGTVSPPSSATPRPRFPTRTPVVADGRVYLPMLRIALR